MRSRSALSSATPKTLLHLVHFEGHPWLWYFLLWLPSRFTHDPIGMKWVEGVLGTAILAVFGLLSPFTAVQRILLFFGYFFVWEYTVMNRMYSVMLLLTLVYAWRRGRGDGGLIGNVLLLGMIGNTDMTGILLSGALFVEYGYTTFRRAGRQQGTREWVRQWTGAAAGYLALVALSIATLIPSPEISWQSSGRMGHQALSATHIVKCLANVIAGPWWPLSPAFPHHYWETDGATNHWLFLLVPLVLCAYWLAFRKNTSLILLMCVTIAFAALFADVVYSGRARHWGITFIVFVVGLWWQKARSRERSWHWSTYALVGLSAVAGMAITVGAWQHPFSRARDAAVWVQASVPAGEPVIGAPDVSFASFAAEWQRPVYFMECRCSRGFKLFSRTTEDFPEEEWPSRINAAMGDLHTDRLVFLSYRQLQPRDLGPMEASGADALSAGDVCRGGCADGELFCV